MRARRARRRHPFDLRTGAPLAARGRRALADARHAQPGVGRCRRRAERRAGRLDPRDPLFRVARWGAMIGLRADEEQILAELGRGASGLRVSLALADAMDRHLVRHYARAAPPEGL